MRAGSPFAAVVATHVDPRTGAEDVWSIALEGAGHAYISGWPRTVVQAHADSINAAVAAREARLAGALKAVVAELRELGDHNDDCDAVTSMATSGPCNCSLGAAHAAACAALDDYEAS